MPRAGEVAPTEEELAIRRTRARDMRVMGKTYREISAELGVTEAQAFADVNHETLRLRKELAEAADDVRDQELARLDIALKGIMPSVEKGSTEDIEVMLKLQTRRAKLLGLDAPVKQTIDVNDTRDKQLTAGQLQQRLRELQAKLQRQITEGSTIEGEVVHEEEMQRVPEEARALPAGNKTPER